MFLSPSIVSFSIAIVVTSNAIVLKSIAIFLESKHFLFESKPLVAVENKQLLVESIGIEKATRWFYRNFDMNGHS
jgi:hypothetical protein